MRPSSAVPISIEACFFSVECILMEDASLMSSFVIVSSQPFSVNYCADAFRWSGSFGYEAFPLLIAFMDCSCDSGYGYCYLGVLTFLFFFTFFCAAVEPGGKTGDDGIAPYKAI